MIGSKPDAAVEISTPAGIIFQGRANAIEFHTGAGLISINTLEETYLTVLANAHLTLRHGENSVAFELKNASAGWRGGTLSVIAEEAVAVPGTSTNGTKPINSR